MFTTFPSNSVLCSSMLTLAGRSAQYENTLLTLNAAFRAKDGTCYQFGENADGPNFDQPSKCVNCAEIYPALSRLAAITNSKNKYVRFKLMNASPRKRPRGGDSHHQGSPKSTTRYSLFLSNSEKPLATFIH